MLMDGRTASERTPLPELLHSSGVVAIARRLASTSIVGVAEACVRGGVGAFEVTLGGSDALGSIEVLARRYGDGHALLVGAGTILDVTDAGRAVDAGARFLVMPHLDEELVGWARERAVPVFPGAFSPTEVLRAWRAGASAVKLFPASSAGPSFVRELSGPLPEIPLIPTGGITSETAGPFIAAGSVAVGVGSWLTASGDPGIVEVRARAVVDAVRAARGSA